MLWKHRSSSRKMQVLASQTITRSRWYKKQDFLGPKCFEYSFTKSDASSTLANKKEELQREEFLSWYRGGFGMSSRLPLAADCPSGSREDAEPVHFFSSADQILLVFPFLKKKIKVYSSNHTM